MRELRRRRVPPSTIPPAINRSTSCAPCSARRGCLDGVFPAAGQDLHGTDTGAVQRLVCISLWSRQRGVRAVLLPWRPEGLSRPGLFPAALNAIRCTGRLCPRVRDRHEVGHHVQDLQGISSVAEHAEQRTTGGCQPRVHRSGAAGGLLRRCLGGTGQSHPQDSRAGRSGAGLQAASSVGDDTLQKRTQGTVVPDSFTHGTSRSGSSGSGAGFDSGQIGTAIPLRQDRHSRRRSLRWSHRCGLPAVPALRGGSHVAENSHDAIERRVVFGIRQRRVGVRDEHQPIVEHHRITRRGFAADVAERATMTTVSTPRARNAASIVEAPGRNALIAFCR